VLALVDLDGTLVDRDAGFARWARDFAQAHNLNGRELVWLEHTDLAVKERGRFFTLVSQRFPHAGTRDALWNDYRAQMPTLAPAFPGVLKELARLRQRNWQLAVVTNGRIDNQLGKLRRTGLLDLLDAVCISEEIGIRKLDPGIYLAAAQRCGVAEPALCWVVGDDPELDIGCGAAAGMPTLWISHQRPWRGDTIRPHLIASTPAQGLALLGVQHDR